MLLYNSFGSELVKAVGSRTSLEKAKTAVVIKQLRPQRANLRDIKDRTPECRVVLSAVFVL